MPKVVNIADQEAERIEAVRVACDRFDAGFTRSARGNLWRRWEGKALTAFKREDGTFAWSIADGSDVRFSPCSYGSEADAIGGLWFELEGWAL
jgi:hypothetical protein